MLDQKKDGGFAKGTSFLCCQNYLGMKLVLLRIFQILQNYPHPIAKDKRILNEPNQPLTLNSRATKYSNLDSNNTEIDARRVVALCERDHCW
jgi:hypothetical protein